MRGFCIIIISLLFVTGAVAQEGTILYSHYSFDGLALNPAYAGSREVLSVSLSHRTQWTGFEGAPSYNVFAVHSPMKKTSVGLGLLVMNESIGLRKYTGIYLNYAHRMTLGRGKLALGLKAGVATGKFGDINLGDDDLVFNEKSNKFLLPNFGLGLYYYTGSFYAGVSIPLILGYKTNASGEITAYHDFNHYAYCLTTGATVALSGDWSLLPSVLVQYGKAQGTVADGTLRMRYKDILGFGASYRNKQSIAMLVDVKVNYQLRVGVDYDYGFGGISEYSRNSFEVALEYNFSYQVKASNPTQF